MKDAQGHGSEGSGAAHQRGVEKASATMTRQHFEMIASTLASSGASAEIVKNFADKLAATNPRFDAARFTAAASKSSGAKK
jgi:hypothetical protein